MNGIKTKVKFHVVPAETMRYDVILGRNFVANPEIEITSKDRLILRKIEVNSVNYEEDYFNELLLIDNNIVEANEATELKVNAQLFV